MGEASERIYNKLKLLSGYLGEVATVLRGLTVSQYQSDSLRRHAAERLAELIIEAAIDINGELVLAARQPPPDDYYTSFLVLAKLGVCDPPLAGRLAPTAGFRNRLAHEYEAVDDALAYETITLLPALYQEYVRAVTTYVDRQQP